MYINHTPVHIQLKLILVYILILINILSVTLYV